MEQPRDEAIKTEELEFLVKGPVGGQAGSYGFTGHLGSEACRKHSLCWKERLTQAYLNNRWKDHPALGPSRVVSGDLEISQKIHNEQ